MDEVFTGLVVDKLREALTYPLDSPARYNALSDIEHLILPYADEDFTEWAGKFHRSLPDEGRSRVPTGRFLIEIMSACKRMGLFLTDWEEGHE